MSRRRHSCLFSGGSAGCNVAVIHGIRGKGFCSRQEARVIAQRLTLKTETVCATYTLAAKHVEMPRTRGTPWLSFASICNFWRPFDLSIGLYPDCSRSPSFSPALLTRSLGPPHFRVHRTNADVGGRDICSAILEVIHFFLKSCGDHYVIM